MAQVYSNRSFKRTFIFLNKHLEAVPTGKKWTALEDSGRVKELFFTKNHSADDIGRLLLASFPSLLGQDIKSLTFIKSYEKGHVMNIVSKSLLSGAQLMSKYSGINRVFFLLPAATGTANAASGSASVQVDLTTPPIRRHALHVANPVLPSVDSTSRPPTDGKSTRQLLLRMATQNAADNIQSDSDHSSDEGPACAAVSRIKIKGKFGPLYNQVCESVGSIAIHKLNDDSDGLHLPGLPQLQTSMLAGSCHGLPFIGIQFKSLCHHIYSDLKIGVIMMTKHTDSFSQRENKMLRSLSEAYYTGDINPICWIASRDSAEGLKAIQLLLGGEPIKEPELLVVVPSQKSRTPTLLKRLTDPANLVEVLHRAREELVVLKRKKVAEREESRTKERASKHEKRQQPELLKNDVNTLTVTKLEQQLLKKDDVLTASEKQQLLKIRESRKKRISKEPGNDDYFKIIIQHPGSSGRPAVGRRFKKDALYQEVYDWAGSEESLPLHFVLKRNGMEVVRHSDPIQGHGVLDLCERTEDQIRSLLGCQVSFKGTYMCATDEELHSTVVDDPVIQNEDPEKKDQGEEKEGKEGEEKEGKEGEQGEEMEEKERVEQNEGGKKEDSKTRKRRKDNRTNAQRNKAKKVRKDNENKE